ncbi:C-Jun-amino-terminal kinase-interacting protein 4 [Araneus ventricosus]|uniref:C-Jun-amino-terminal kinase-interacting protein 4 n=1 Tax=Araneus ventricosus TaxID=182803 RepID=A0A4Y2M596_ARAVE|nr:C-Jun-amino-terminal kinase-interacting protein 4 [Araneus ventricosus]
MEIDPSLMHETVYGVSPGEECHVMSDKVQTLANNIYEEFARMISKYDEDVVKQLMPLVISVLEHLDLSFVENQEHEVELELLREDNEQLVTQFEREKQLRKSAEQKLLELEYSVDEDKRELQSKEESLESLVRILEIKAKNSADHAARLEEKETEMKKEYAKLHERYTEVFRTHVDYVERTKILFGNEKAEMISSKARVYEISMPFDLNCYCSSDLCSEHQYCMFHGHSIPQLKSGSLYSVSSEESSIKSLSSPPDFSGLTPPNHVTESVRCLQNELHDVHSSVKSPNSDMKPSQKSGWTDGFGSDLTDLSISSNPDVDDMNDLSSMDMPPLATVNNEKRRPNTLYQELSFQEGENIPEDDGNDIAAPDSFFGMGREVENLILENNELLATKNALNIVKDDLIAKVDELTSEMEILQGEIKSLQAVKERLKQRVIDLEEELRKTKEEAEKAKAKFEEEEDIPLAQRKRFTRVEMARVLMERNQYKEKLMELQEAVRWTEMIRASRNDPSSDQKKNQSSIRKFFSSLFSSSSSSEKTVRKSPTSSGILYSSPSVHVSPTLESLRKTRLGEKGKSVDFLDSDLASERLQQQRARERKEQYKQVRAHVKKEDGRMQAYGWSLPIHDSNSDGEETKSSLSFDPNFPVPIPVYCRPLMDKEPGMKIWCAAGVNLNGGRTRDGGSIVGASVFYSSPPEDGSLSEDLSEVDKLDHELAEGEKTRIENEKMEQRLSSLIWIGTSTHTNSKVNVIDARNPADVLSSFFVCSSHLLCIASVPGACESDYPVDEEFLKLGVEADKTDIPDDTKSSDSVSSIGNITFVSCSTGPSSSPSPTNDDKESEPVLFRQSTTACEDKVSENSESAPEPNRQQQWIVMKDPPEIIKDGISELSKDNPLAYDHIEKMSSVLPTMWMGAQNGSIYVHSSVAQWWRCIHTVKLKDAVLNIVHIKGRVLAAMANGTVAIFHRGEDNQWELNNYHLLDLGYPHYSIRCMAVVHNKVWCGYRNTVHVLCPKTLSIEKSFDAHPRKESQVRQLAWVGEGVWISIRLDSTLRLYHAHTYQHLQDVDIEPYISKILGTGKLGFSFVRITALAVSCSRLWIGTGNGVILSVPLHESGKKRKPNDDSLDSIRVYTDGKDNVTPGSFVPYCNMSEAQLSFHGHKDAVKFFVAVPGMMESKALQSTYFSKGQGDMSSITSLADDKEDDTSEKPAKPKYMYIMSGAEGYIDFRIEDAVEDAIIWNAADLGKVVFKKGVGGDQKNNTFFDLLQMKRDQAETESMVHYGLLKYVPNGL